MSLQSVELKPFPGLPAPAGVAIAGTAQRQGAQLFLEWRVTAPAGTLELPPRAEQRQRRFGLWEATCFECFLATPGRPGYREFNLSPAGHWNVFRFDGYRAGMVDEGAIGELPFTMTHAAGGCTAATVIDLAALGGAAAPWRLAMSMVIRTPAGELSYWAIAHPAAEPDFHHPEAFALTVPGSRT